MKAEQIIYGIAVNAATYNANPGGFFGYIEKVKKTSIDLVWTRSGKSETLTITSRCVVASRSNVEQNGKIRTWYSYTLDPFGEDVGYGEQCQVVDLMLKKFGIQIVAA
ncbi:MAG: hypothetical protein HKM02_07765 [Pseudomonadales bacterium]|nr:hypothetical protein [Pseudomonadales bacterium]